MPATFISTEVFPSTTPEADIKEEIRLRIKAGAIRCWVDASAPKWTLKTEWNVIGEQ